MNSFFVPQLGSQIYTMAGMTTTLHLQADRAGTYPGLSAQFSGDGFSDMRFDAVAASPAQFQQWVAGVREGAGKLDAAGYAELARPSVAASTPTYGQVAPGLFHAIVEASGQPPAATMAMH
jgi:cytochrome o ubiquinol oxidase subunit 2